MLGVDLALSLTYDNSSILSRTKRYYKYVAGSAMGIFVAFAIPLELENQDVLFSYNFEANYNLPTDTAEFDIRPPEEAARSPRSINRTFIYDYLRNRLQSFGYHGKWCLLKTICQLAQHPITHNGLLGQLLHVIFTPSESEDEGLIEEAEAESNGRNGLNCISHYPKCQEDLLSGISFLAPDHLEATFDKSTPDLKAMYGRP